MRLLTLRALQAEKPEHEGLLEDADRRFLDETGRSCPAAQLTQTEGTRPRKLLRGRYANVNDFKQLSENLRIPVDRLFDELIRYSRRSLKDRERLPDDEERLSRMPVEQFNQLQIPVLAFQETDIYDTHHARTTGERSFRNGTSRNDWVWVAVGTVGEYGALRGQLPGKLRRLFKVRTGNTVVDAKSVYRLAVVQLLQVQGGGHITDAHDLVKVSNRPRTSDKDEFWIVDIVTISGVAHLIPEGDGRWLVNSRIDLKTFNDVY